MELIKSLIILNNELPNNLNNIFLNEDLIQDLVFNLIQHDCYNYNITIIIIFLLVNDILFIFLLSFLLNQNGSIFGEKK